MSRHNTVTNVLTLETEPSKDCIDSPARLLTVEQARGYLNVSASTMERLITSRRIRVAKILGCRRIDSDDLKGFIERCKRNA